MAKTLRNSQIKRDRRNILATLNTVYAGSMNGEELFLILLDANPNYERRFLAKDLHYLSEKEYLKCKGAHGVDVVGLRVDKDHLYYLTYKGNEVAEAIVSDPALEI